MPTKIIEVDDDIRSFLTNALILAANQYEAGDDQAVHLRKARARRKGAKS
jgi:hypothetical protein